uniref:Uncharacterized protein n=1 Tax=Romanomermis culicivorax TaxID=13658 RepID=A0A915JHG1_ROMCU
MESDDNLYNSDDEFKPNPGLLSQVENPKDDLLKIESNATSSEAEEMPASRCLIPVMTNKHSRLEPRDLDKLIEDPFSRYGPPETLRVYKMKFDHQIAETRALTPLYLVPNHNKWMNAIQLTMPDSKDRQKKIEWASALKRDQLRKEELEGKQPPTADSDRMIDELTTSQQAEVAIVQQKPQ